MVGFGDRIARLFYFSWDENRTGRLTPGPNLALLENVTMVVDLGADMLSEALVRGGDLSAAVRAFVCGLAYNAEGVRQEDELLAPASLPESMLRRMFMRKSRLQCILAALEAAAGWAGGLDGNWVNLLDLRLLAIPNRLGFPDTAAERQALAYAASPATCARWDAACRALLARSLDADAELSDDLRAHLRAVASSAAAMAVSMQFWAAKDPRGPAETVAARTVAACLNPATLTLLKTMADAWVAVSNSPQLNDELGVYSQWPGLAVLNLLSVDFAAAAEVGAVATADINLVLVQEAALRLAHMAATGPCVLKCVTERGQTLLAESFLISALNASTRLLRTMDMFLSVRGQSMTGQQLWEELIPLQLELASAALRAVRSLAALNPDQLRCLSHLGLEDATPKRLDEFLGQARARAFFYLSHFRGPRRGLAARAQRCPRRCRPAGAGCAGGGAAAGEVH